MDLMEDPVFKSKYHKYKIRVKFWETEFMEKFGRKPNKNDIKTADMTIRNAYKMYWKLKTTALEETLTEITFCKNSAENILDNDTNLESNKNLKNEEHKYKKISKTSKLIHSENIYPNDYLPKLTSSSTNLIKKVNVKETWNQNLNMNEDYIRNNNRTPLIGRSSSFQLSQKMFKTQNFSKRNPKKSLFLTKVDKSKKEFNVFSNETKIYCNLSKDYKHSNLLDSSCNQNFKIIYDDKKISDQPTIQKLMERFTTTYNRQLNHDWLNRCIENDMLISSQLEVQRLTANSNSEFKSFECIHISNENLLIQNSLQNKSFTDDEDYIFNSDSEEERKNKRIRNFNKISYDCGLQPSKKKCVIDAHMYKTKIDKEIFQNSLADIHKIKCSNDVICTLSHQNTDGFDTREFKKYNNDPEKKIKQKKHIQIKHKTTFNNVSFSTYIKKKPQKLTQQKYFYKNESIIDKNEKNTINQIPTINVESLCVIPCSRVKGTISSNKANSLSIHSKSYTKKKIEQSIDVKKLNDNFIKINLKKKVFVHGKKLFNLSQYKKKQWKQRKKNPNLHDTNLHLSNSFDINNKFLCFKCGEMGHFAKHCKNLKDNLLFSDISTKLSSSVPLDEAEEMTKLSSIEIIGTPITDLGCENILSIQSEQIDCNNFSNIYANKTDINHLNSFICKYPQIQEIPPLYKLESDHSVKDTPLEVLMALKKFGYNKFRIGQEKAIMRILSGQSTLVTLGTGSGKSLCYQLPAYLYAKKSACLTLVISPLVSLMDDQISKIPNFLQAACLHNNQSSKLQSKIITKLKEGKLNILLISPELIVGKEKLNDLGNILKILPPIAFACIDEVHCLSQWSHNFRPAYLMICKVLHEKLGIKRILGLTATARKSTVMNIINLLNIKDGMAGVISEKSIPSNLNLTVSRDQYKEDSLINLLRSERYNKCDSIIVYCTRREECVRVAKILRLSLQEYNLKEATSKYQISSIAEVYHAGLSAYRRKIVQASFMKSETRIIVSTVAFGMGINKPNIRSVIHFNMPSSLEGYVQEIGRAGRDGLPAYCHLFLNPKENLDEYELRRHINANRIDRHTIRRLLQKIFVPCCCTKLDSKVRCTGHEIAFPVDETEKLLDINKETITTLLCYLELHPKHFIKLLPSTFINAQISSYKGPNALKLCARTSPPLAMALDLLMKSGSYKNNSTIEFPVIDIAAAIGLDSAIVKNQLKNLEWITVNGTLKKSAISVKFNTIGFRVIAFGDLSNEELEEALESLSQQNQLHVITSMQQLRFVSTTMRNFSFVSVRKCFETNQETRLKSEELKNTICNYFELDEPLLNISFPIEAKLKNEACIVADIRNLILSYKNIHFTGRSIARIFHGIQSPNYSAFTWSKCSFWRAHITDDFDTICQIATKELLKIKEI